MIKLVFLYIVVLLFIIITILIFSKVQLKIENFKFTSKDIKQAMLDECPVLKTMYSADDGKFEIFYITNTSATVFSLCGKKETLET